MIEGLRDRLRALPKTDLHVHLDGSLRPDTLVELADIYGKKLPVAETVALREHMCVRDAHNLVDYLARFDITLAVLQTADALGRAAYELAIDAAAENIRYMEVRYSPVLNTREGLRLEEAVEATLDGLARAGRETGIRTGIIICALRHMSPAVSLELARLAIAFKGRGVVAFDLAGPECDHPPGQHREAFQLAADANLALTIHAGEAFGPASIHQAIHACGANRIGHGTHLFEDAELMEYVRDFSIPLEICLTSNVQTHAVRSFGEHPLGLYYRSGLVVTLNTDNRLMSGTTLTDEYWRAHEHLGLEWEALCEIALMGFESAFLPRMQKMALLEQARSEIASLKVGARA